MRLRTQRSCVRAQALLVSVLIAAMFWSSGHGQAPDAAPIDRAVLERAERQKGDVTFWILLREKAALAPAAAVQSKKARGRFVYERATEVAARSQADLQRFLRARRVSFQSFWIVNAIRVSGDTSLVQELARRPDVERIVEDRVYNLPTAESQQADLSILAVEWGIDRIGAPLVWSNFNVRGEGVVVANIDSGVRYDHPALIRQYRGNLGNGTFDHNYNWFDPARACVSPAPCDNTGHGTHTMGIIAGDDGAGNQIGVAPGVRWISAKGCETDSCSTASLLAAGQWVLAPTNLADVNPRPDLAPDIVNNSWFVSDGADPFYQGTIQSWLAAGIFPAFAAGDAGPSCGSVAAPASYTGTYAVGAFDINNAIAPFSSRGPAPAAVGRGTKPNIAAPGVNIRSSWNDGGYSTQSGTSMAVPHLAGTVALMWSAAPSLFGDIGQTRTILDQAASDVSDLSCGGTPGNNNVWGQGRLDAFAAVSRAAGGAVGTLDGTVTDAGSSSPLSGVTIEVTGPTDRTTMTDAAGHYTLTLPVGSYALTVSRFGYVTQTAMVTIGTGAVTTNNFALTAITLRTVSGRVLDTLSAAIPNAKVTLEGAAIPSASTDASGFYSFANVPDGTYNITASAGCTAPVTRSIVVDGNESVDFALTVTQDGFGYSCRVEVSSYIEAATPVTLDGDDSATAIPLPFSFPFYGETYNTAFVATNGFLTFLGSSTEASNVALPATTMPNGAIYAFWDDLVFDQDTSLRTHLLGVSPSRRFVIEWRNVRFLDDGPRLDFEVVLHENGQILVQYRNISTNGREQGSSATLGIENPSGTIGLQYSFNEAVVSEGLAVRYRLRSQAWVEGIVTDANDGAALDGATVQALQGSTVVKQTTTDPSGSYRLQLPLGTYTLRVSKNSYQTATTPVVLDAEDQVVTKNVALVTGRLTVSPTSLQFSLTPGASATSNISLGNNGGAAVTWTVEETPAAAWLTVVPAGGSLAAGGNAAVAVSVNGAGLPGGVYTTTLVFTSNSGRQLTTAVPVRLVLSGYQQGVNAGGGAYTDAAGVVWAADRQYAPGSFGYTGKNAKAESTSQPIAGTSDDALYQSQRQDPIEYVFDGLPAGVYEFELGFVESQPQGRDTRIHQVSIENTVVLAAHDVKAEVGGFTADRHVFTVSVTDGQANIRITQRTGSRKPTISALRVTHRPDLP